MSPSTQNNRSSIFHAGDGTPRVITAYPIRNGAMFNLSCILRTEVSTKATTESWHVDGDKKEMVKSFQDFDPLVVKVLEAATDVKVWELQDLEPLSTWSRGWAILIGDAAHAMTPMQGQGGLFPGTRVLGANLCGHRCQHGARRRRSIEFVECFRCDEPRRAKYLQDN